MQDPDRYYSEKQDLDVSKGSGFATLPLGKISQEREDRMART
jgi:hypothetical protein